MTVSARPRVAVAALPLVDPETRRAVSLERWHYALQLSKLLRDTGYDVSWWQPGGGWTARMMPEVPLNGVLSGAPQLFTWPRTADDFRERTAGYDFTLYFDFILAYPQASEGSIAVVHGVDWDDPLFESRLRDEESRAEWRRRLWIALTGPDRVVATDTNVIQWATTTWPGLQYKFAYVPNFVPPEAASTPTPVATSDFGPATASTPAPTSVPPPGPERPFTVLSVTPLLPREGVADMTRAARKMLDAGDDVRFRFVGGATPPVAEYMERLAAQRPGLQWEPGFDPLQAMDEADVVVFPARSGQSTSMHCLAAMARGKPVIVGQIGGLTDLVLHGHNGIVIRAGAERLVAAVTYLLRRPVERRKMGEAAREVADAFSLQRWRERWSAVVTDVFRGGRT